MSTSLRRLILLSVWLWAAMIAGIEAAAAGYMVQIVGYGGRIDAEFGPFDTDEEAESYGRRWSASRPNDFRLWRVVQVKAEGGGFSPIDRILARGTAELDAVLQQTREVAKNTGADIPDAGTVLNEYRQTVEMSAANAKALQDKLVEFAKTGVQTSLAGTERLANQLMQSESDLFVEQRRLELNRLVYDEADKAAIEKRRPAQQLLDQIAAAQDSVEQKRLIEQLREMEISGELREVILKNTKAMVARDELDVTQKKLSEIQQAIDDGKKQQQQILAALAPKPKLPLQKADAVFVGTKWLHDVGNFKWLEFGSNGQVIWYRPDGSSFSSPLEAWRQEGDQAILTFEGRIIIRLQINGDTLEGQYPDQQATLKYGTRVK